MTRFVGHFTHEETDLTPASTFLAARTPLSKAKIKVAMCHGAVWLHRAQQKPQRLRRATKDLKTGDRISIYYDEALLGQRPPSASLIEDCKDYSVWFKPSGLLAQGNEYGDHCSLLRQVELHYALARPVLLVHRLDRETRGLMLLAHNRLAAAKLSELLREHSIEKLYRLEVRGKPGAENKELTIDLKLDGKPALTHYRLESYCSQTDTSIVLATLVTGRTHQLRRHFAAIDHPLIGDPRYGQGNKNTEGLQLTAVGIQFVCPLTSRLRQFRLPDHEATNTD
jgi:tRNA pseudouridine32 synthase / 23S rRNA pseudouridine746 synthase